MSFFQEEGDDSNLQYDDAAFLYFIASTLIVAAAVVFALIVRDLLSLRIQNKGKIQSTVFLRKKLANLSALKKKKVFNYKFVLKIIVLAILIALTVGVYLQSRRNSNQMKGFDPFEILGLARGATLQQVKKAYRKLALEFHPDKNIGNPDAQAKFILISKSYECFTDQTKKANCFKFGNPDGVNSFRIGIGLPKFFIEVQYKWYVLPLVLSIFLLIIPAYIVKWSNKNSASDPNGVSIHSYKTLFKCLDSPLTKYSGICLLASYKQLYEDLGYGDISPANKKRLEQELQKHPELNLPIIAQFNDKQLNIYWEIYKYLARIEDFTHPEFAEQVEKYIALTLQTLKVFAMEENDGVRILGNPQWTIKFFGTTIIEVVCQFYRDYYNRTLLDLNRRDIWLQNLDLSDQEINIGKAHPIENIYNFLKMNKIDQYIQIFKEDRRQQIKLQMESLPVYEVQYKTLIDGKQVQNISNYDFAVIKYKVSRLNKGAPYCVLSQYPYPKVQGGYMLAILNGSLIKIQKIEFTAENYYIGKFQFRWPSVGPIPLFLYFISTTYSGLDVFTQLKLNGIEPPQEINKKVEFHPQDINIEKTHKTFFEELMTIELDPQENELSDSEEQQQVEEIEKK